MGPYHGASSHKTPGRGFCQPSIRACVQPKRLCHSLAPRGKCHPLAGWGLTFWREVPAMCSEGMLTIAQVIRHGRQAPKRPGGRFPRHQRCKGSNVRSKKTTPSPMKARAGSFSPRPTGGTTPKPGSRCSNGSMARSMSSIQNWENPKPGPQKETTHKRHPKQPGWSRREWPPQSSSEAAPPRRPESLRGDVFPLA